jgi:hypothetical protein
MALDTNSGSYVIKRTPDPLDQIIVGTDSKIYIVNQTSIRQITIQPDQISIENTIKWDLHSFGGSFRNSNDVGITPEKQIWLYFGSSYLYMKIIWLEANGIMLASLDYPYGGMGGKMIGVDPKETILVCGFDSNFQNEGDECRANRAGSPNPLWKIKFEDGVAGSAVIPGRIYFATGNGTLQAYEDIK